MATKQAPQIDPELVKALSHPLRVRILEALQDRVASPSDLAQEMDESLGLISYHANMLVKCGCLELVGTEPRRGALEHYFHATPRSFVGHQDWRLAPRSVRAGVTEAAVRSFTDKASAALEAGTIDRRDDTTFSWMPMRVDEAGWEEVVAILGEAVEKLTAVHERAAARLAREDGFPVVVAVAGFEAGAAAELEAAPTAG